MAAKKRAKKAAKTTTKAANDKVTHVAIVLDDSGSMGWCWTKALQAMERVLEELRAGAATTHTVTVSLVQFSSSARTAYAGRALALRGNALPMDGGGTALFDGIWKAVDELSKLPTTNDTAYLVICITDGGENASRHCSLEQFRNLVSEKAGWAFTFQMPPNSATRFAMAYGVPRGNCREWEATEQGMQEAFVATSAATSSYMGTRGITKAASLHTKSFYTDLSSVGVKDLATKLADASDRFKVYEVPQEAQIKDFIEAKTRAPYVIGQGYYQLMKSEQVQGTKSVCIMEKGKRAIWAGDAARALVGLAPYSANQTARVKPGNHANYDIFVQSASTNRKLPRGTKVLVDVKQQHAVPATFDHTLQP